MWAVLGGREREHLPEPTRPRSNRVSAPTHSPSEFVGREGDLERIAARLEQGTQLITVFGPPGIGKTRLVSEFLRNRLDSETAHFYCDLRSALDVDELFTGLGLTLGLQLVERAEANSLATSIGRALSARPRSLIVLDNLEPVATAAREALASWLNAAPNVQWIVTSRQALRLQAEVVHEVGPLSLPASHDDGRADATRLFLERVQAVEPGLDLRSQCRAVATLMTRLAGNPLAIELAAAQARHAGPTDLLSRWDRIHEELCSPFADADPRHRSLEAAIETSWRLLDPSDQEHLARLSLCTHGFTTEAASHLLDLEPGATRRVVGRLRNASLLRVAETNPATGGLRWAAYDAVARFATARLDVRQAEAARSRHAEFFLEWGERWIRELSGSQGREARITLSHELPNLQQAYHFFSQASPRSSETPNSSMDGDELLARIALVLFESVRRWLPSIALDPLNQALHHGRRATPVRVSLLCARAHLQSQVGQHTGAEADLREARRCLRAGDHSECKVLLEEAWLAYQRGWVDIAGDRASAAATLAEQLGQRHMEARAHRLAGQALAEADLDVAALARCARATALLEQEGDVVEAALSRMVVAVETVFFQQGDATQALEKEIELLFDCREYDWAARGLTVVGLAYEEQRCFPEARACYERARQLAAEAGLRWVEALSHVRAGHLSETEGNLQRAQFAYERGISIFENLGADRDHGWATLLLSGAVGGLGDVFGARQLLKQATALFGHGSKSGLEALIPLQEARIDLLRTRAEHEIDPARAAKPLARAHQAITVTRIAKAQPGQTGTLFQSSPEIRIVVRLLEREIERYEEKPRLRVWPNGSAFQLGDQARVTLPRGPVMRRLLQTLTDAHLSGGERLDHDVLIARCWPDERIHPEAASKRLRELVHRLRKLGLDHMLLTVERGYSFDPQIKVEIAPMRPAGR